MRAVMIRELGDADGLVVTDLPEPEVGPGRLLVETEAVGVGGVDAVIRRGTLGSRFPVGTVAGSEVAGTVIGVGDGIDPGWTGRRVWAFTGVGGAYAERVTAVPDDVTVLPDRLSAVDAVALGSAAPVAHFALGHGRFAAGGSVLVRGAAGSIGIAAVQLAAAAGAGRIGVTTSSVERGDRLRALGATTVLDRAGRLLAAEVDADPADAAGWDVVLDVVGGADVPEVLGRLAPNGRYVAVGVVAGYPPADVGMTLMRLFQRSLTFSTFSLDTVPVPERNRVRAELLATAARGDLTAVVHDVLPLDRAAEAHRRMDAGEVFGRIVLIP
ncbi:MAG TPA: zinc-binding dehydrogenase [Cellulomonas sp.]